MADRGDYSPIARVLRDGPDFQRLSTPARYVFIDLKIAFGPCGIEVRYPDALVSELAHTTGYPVTQARAALDELEAAGWIAREHNLVWIIGQLEFHPNMSPKNPKHRAGVQNHVRGLPRIALVRRFIDRYAPFFAGIDNPADGYPEGTDTPSIPTPVTEATSDAETDDTAAGNGPTDDGFVYPSEFERAWELYPKRPNNPKRAAWKAWAARVRAKVPADELLEGVIRYAAYCAGKGIVGSETVMQARTFFGPDERWKEEYPAQPATGHGSALADRARVLYRLYKTYGLLTFTAGAKEHNRQKLDLAMADDDAGPDFRAELLKVKPWEPAIAGASAERFALAEIERRLATNGAAATPAARIA